MARRRTGTACSVGPERLRRWSSPNLPSDCQAQLVTVGGSTVGRFTFEPGWRWSTSVKPIVGTDRCENHHVGYAIAGHMHVVDAAGIGAEIAAGEAYDIAPGHDAWTIGGDTFVGLEFKSSDQYAKPK